MALITCPDCDSSISPGATTCPGCGAPANGVVLVQPPKTGVLTIIAAVVVILGIAIATFWLVFGSRALGPPAAKLKASALAAAFERDEDAAMSKYADKVVQIEGKYTASDMSPDSAWIILDGQKHPRGMTGVQCHFRDVEEANRIPKDQSVKLKGRVESLKIYVQMLNCERVF